MDQHPELLADCETVSISNVGLDFAIAGSLLIIASRTDEATRTALTVLDAALLISTAIYGLTTVAGGNPVLIAAALILGLVVGLQRRAGGGILAPVLTHITWSMIMLFALPPIFSGVR